jgi:hypothetical protein
MKRLLVALLFAFSPIAAHAADSITFSISDGIDGSPSAVFPIANDAATTNLVAAYQQGCNTSINGTCSRSQVLGYIANWIMTQLQNKTDEYNSSAASATAIANAPTIVITAAPVQ